MDLDIGNLKSSLAADQDSASLHYQLGLAYLAEQPLFSSLRDDELSVYSFLYSCTRSGTSFSLGEDLLAVYGFLHSTTRSGTSFEIPGLGKLKIKDAAEEINIANAIGLSSPLQAAKARLLLILLYRSEQNQRWIDEANHALNEKRKLDEEIEEVFEEIPSVEEIAKEMISPLESRLQNPEFTKQDYWWYLDRGNKDARTFLRKHYYSNFPGFRNAGSVQKDAFELNNRPTVSDLKKLEHQLKMDKERRIRKEIMGARQKAINKHKQLTEGCASS